MSIQKNELQPEYLQEYYSPYSGALGPGVMAALYLDARWNLFSTWLENCHIDSGCCRTWVDDRLMLLKMMQSVKQLNTGVANFTDHGSRGMDLLTITSESSMGTLAVTSPKTKCLEMKKIKHIRYGTETSMLLAGLFLKDNESDFKAWIHTMNISPHPFIAWSEKQVFNFQALIGRKITETNAPHVTGT